MKREKLMEKLAACVGVFSRSAVNRDELKDIRKLQENLHEVYDFIGRSGKR